MLLVLPARKMLKERANMDVEGHGRGKKVTLGKECGNCFSE